jgi:hypothetical protein
MPDAARIAQAQALEVPVVLKGAKAEGDSRNAETFTENATTVLVFDNGAVFNLHTRLTVGQTVFLHNTQNGREALCKVLETPAEGETGYTDLEFTTAETDFWNADAGGEAQAEAEAPQAAAASEPAPEVHVPSGSPSDDPLAMMLQTASKIDVPSMTRPDKESGMPLKEELMSAHEMAPDVAPAPHFPDPTAESFGAASQSELASTTKSPAAAEPTGDQIDAALKQMSSAAAPPAEPSTAEYAEDDKHIAAMMARDARLAKFAAFKAKQAGQKGPSAKDAATGPAAGADAIYEEEAPARPKIKGLELSFVDRLMTGRNRTYVAIGAGVLIAVAVGFIWQLMRGTFTHSAAPPVAAVLPAAAKSPAPVAATGNPGTPAGTAAPASSAAPTAVVVTEAPEKPARHEERPARSEVRGNGTDAGGAEAPTARHHHAAVGSGAPVESAIVLSQPQPTLPPWAVDVQVDGVVTIDALIDEKGQVTETRVLSGPRALQREAERALSLWVFEPARIDGKAVASHLTLSVQFLPPQPKPKY